MCTRVSLATLKLLTDPGTVVHSRTLKREYEQLIKHYSSENDPDSPDAQSTLQISSFTHNSRLLILSAVLSRCRSFIT